MASQASPPEPAGPALDGGGSRGGDAALPERPDLPLFGCREAYVYRVPPATTVGHRAEMWDVNNWLATVSLRVVQADDDCYVRLLDDKTGELFAECPIPTDHRPLTTAVEPVIDSSRYFVLRIVDRDSQRHAFIGVGFRERSEASDFNAALHEYLQYIKRKRTAEAMRHAYEERLAAGAGEGREGAEGGASLGAEALPDLSIKEGESLRLRIAAPKPAGAGFVSRAAARGALAKTFSLIMDGRGGTVAALSPPPRPGSSPRCDMCVSPSLEGGGGSPMHSDGGSGAGASPGSGASRLGRVSGARDGELQQRLAGLHLQQQAGETSGPASCSGSVASTSTVAAAVADLADDDFGDFEAASPQREQQQQQQEQQQAGKLQEGVAG